MADEPGPPGAEEFADEKHIKKSSISDKKERERRRSPSPSPRRRSPLRRDRRSRSKSRNRNYSPPRRYGGRFRRSPDRTSRINRSRSRDRIDRRRERRSRSRDRFRGRRNNSRSRSVSPRRHWSPNVKKPVSPPIPPPPQAAVALNSQNQQFSAPPPPIFNDGYTAYPNQYSGPQTFGVPDYAAPPPPPPQFTAAYPPPPAWTMPVQPVEVYAAQAPPAWPTTNPQIQAPPIQTQPPEPSVDQLKREAAVAQEVQNQREELKKQRNDYLKKATNMKKELKMLKDQMIELSGSGDAPPSPTTKGYIDENEKLQGQIQKKINTIENVIDMLSGIIGVDKKPPTPPVMNVQQKKLKKKKSTTSSSSSSSSEDNSSPERLKTKIIESMKSKRESKDKIKEEIKKRDFSPNEKKINYIFYDPEMHWCKSCNVFPKSAKDFLNHLHTKEHTKSNETQTAPWHDIPFNDEFSNIPNAPSKRTPIRGLQFFVPATSWFCKLCNFWMGDLHCASAHLKSKTHWESYNTFFQKNLTFEVDWMAERQKAIDTQQRAPPPPPQITSVSTTGNDVFDGIPLRLNTQKSVEVHDKTSKKRKKKSDDKKEKKKKKRSKKRKKGSSSSSTSSSSSSSSESDNEPNKKNKETAEHRASSIRVAMRNVSKHDEQSGQIEIPYAKPESRGKWETIQEALPGSVEAKKKDDLMISQWNTPQPIISESEKKLLEQLKGKLKSKPLDDTKKSNGSSKIDKKDDTRSRNRSLGRRESSPFRDRSNRSRSRGRKSIDKSRSDRRSRSRGRRSRSIDSRGRFKRSRSRNRRSRSRGRISPFRRRRRSPSRDRDRRRRSTSRSRSRSASRRIEKAVVRYPEFRPRVPDQLEPKKKTSKNIEEESERKKSPSGKKSSSSNNNNGTSGGKKLPFIGRMPVLAKKQHEAGSENSTEKKDDETENNESDQIGMHSGYNYPNQVMMLQATAAAGYPHYDHGIDYDDLMPDPMQYVTLMGAPPPPPPPQQYEDEKEILPPGIDETETEFVPKPISDAPIPRKGPLPRDFEEALNIIFPGEKKPEDIQRELAQKAADAEAAVAEQKAIQHAELAKDGIHIVNLEATQAAIDEESHMSVGNDAYMKFSEHSQDVQDMALSDIPAPLPPPLPPQDELSKPKETPLVSETESKKEEIIKDIILEEIKVPSPTNSDKERRQQELDDLAMLGIDADDLAAQCI